MQNKKIFFLTYFLFLLSLLPLGTGILHSQTSDPTAMRFAQTITAADAKKHLSVLASDEYEGRETGKEGQKKAAKYIADAFKKIGLVPATDETYLQKVPLLLTTPGGADLEIGGKKYESQKDFYVLPYPKSLKMEANSILFLGYGISDEKYDDYRNADVKDKVLMVLGGEPLTEDSVSFITGNKELSDWTNSYRKKADFAREKGAHALIVVNENFAGNLEMMKNFLASPTLKLEPDTSKEKTANDKESTPSGKDKNKRLPQIGIPVKMANELFIAGDLPADLKGMKVDDLKKKIRTSKQTVSVELKSSFRLEINNKEERIFSENVLGMIKGSEHPEEVIFITAHYDHLGVRDGKVFNGADDNGSGTVSVMEIAEAFMKAKEAGSAPKRSVVFMTVTGEEKGLLGSSYYTSHPVFPIDKTVCNLNIDMVGRTDDHYKDTTDYLYIIGSDKISTDLHKINEASNSTYTRLKLDYKFNDPNDPNRFYYRSDHYNFAKKGVPIIFYFNGVHDDYHEEADEISKINFDILVKRAQLVFYTAWEIANRKDRIVSDLPAGKAGVPQEKKEKK